MLVALLALFVVEEELAIASVRRSKVLGAATQTTIRVLVARGAIAPLKSPRPRAPQSHRHPLKSPDAAYDLKRGNKLEFDLRQIASCFASATGGCIPQSWGV